MQEKEFYEQILGLRSPWFVFRSEAGHDRSASGCLRLASIGDEVLLP